MAYALCHSTCAGCHRIFGYNPLRVPSIVIKSSREPICADCVERVNPIRIANGLEPIEPLPDAYEAIHESELPLEDDIEFIVKTARAFLHPLLAGHPPEVQSAVLADLTATYLAGVAPPLRPEMRALFIQLVDDFVPENERELFGDDGHPFMRSNQSK